MLQDIVNEYYGRFVGIVLDGMTARGVKMTREELVKYCDGSVFTGQRAKEIGFVDEIGYFEDAVRAACDQAKIKRDETRVIAYRRKPGLLDHAARAHVRAAGAGPGAPAGRPGRRRNAALHVPLVRRRTGGASSNITGK